MPCVVTAIHDPVALDATCQRLGLSPTEEDRVWLGDFEVFGRAVRLTGLHAPLVCDMLTGLVAYHPRDNGFHRYEQRQLDRFLQIYAVERAKIEARGKGYPTTEQTLQDGSIKLQIIERA